MMASKFSTRCASDGQIIGSERLLMISLIVGTCTSLGAVNSSSSGRTALCLVEVHSEARDRTSSSHEVSYNCFDNNYVHMMAITNVIHSDLNGHILNGCIFHGIV